MLIAACFIAVGCVATLLGILNAGCAAAFTPPELRSDTSDAVIYRRIESALDAEGRHKTPPSDLETWDDYWQWRFRYWTRNSRKHFITHVISRRRALGLAPVKGQIYGSL